MNKKKKGLSPVIANVLLVAFVIAIISLVFIWLRGMVEEGIVKFDKNIQLVCDDIDFEVSYNAENILIIQNNGLPPIYTFSVKLTKIGEFSTMDIKDLSEEEGDWISGGLRQGGIYSQLINFEEGVTEVALVPVLVGTDSKNKQRRFTCEGQYERKITV